MTAGERPRLLVFTTHPIQYQAPWFRAIEESGRFDLLVAFSYIPTETEQAVGFGGAFEWDIPLRDGYRSVVLAQHTLDWAPRFARRPASGFRRMLREFRPDVAMVLGWQEFSLVQAVATCRSAGVPLVVRGESNDRRPRSTVMRMLHRAFLSAFDSALAIGMANRRFYEASGFPVGRIVDAPYFVDNDRFAQQADRLRPERSALRKSWGIDERSIVVLFAGKLEPKKRPLDFLAAVARARAAGAPLHVLVAGDGELREVAEAMTRSERVPATFAGFLNQSRIPAAYAASDLLVLPSDHGETWGLVVNEAMATGLPAIVSDQVGCAADLVIDGQTGVVFPVGRIDKLAEALGLLAGDAEARLLLGARARARVHREYSVARAVDGLAAAATLAMQRHRGSSATGRGAP
jgi:glycosyltransferase involved in cell wall biosynthesis